MGAALLTGGTSLVGQYFQNQANSAQAQRQMDFQRDMSDTAHVREVSDLKAAGLNPMLSALGSGASTPAGAMAQQGNLGEGIEKGVNTAIAIKNQQADLQLKGIQGQNTSADTSLKTQDTANKVAEQKLINAQSASTAIDAKNKLLQGKMLEQTMPSMIRKAKAEGDFSEINQIMGVIQSGMNSGKSLIDIITPSPKDHINFNKPEKLLSPRKP